MSSRYEDGNSNGEFVLGLLVGAAVGAVAAMLCAPKSGSEMRQQLKDLAGQQKDNLANQWEQTKASASDAVNSVRNKVDSATEKAKDTVDTYADKAKDSVDELADDTKNTADKFQRRY
jgi:gas vesicle protein